MSAPSVAEHACAGSTACKPGPGLQRTYARTHTGWGEGVGGEYRR